MQPQPQTIPVTKSGTSRNSTNEAQAESKYPSRQELATFYDAIHTARGACEPGNTPEVETTRKLIEHFNQGPMLKGFDSVGYFIYEGVKVFEENKKEAALKLEAMSCEEKVFGKK